MSTALTGTEQTAQAHHVVSEFLEHLQTAFTNKDVLAIEELMLPNGYLRDLLISDWNFASIARDDLKEFWASKGFPDVANISISKTKSAPAYTEATQWIQGFYDFETSSAVGEGMVRLLHDPNDASKPWKALVISLTMRSLKDHPEISGKLRPLGIEHGSRTSTLTWLEARQAQQNFADSDPTVLIVGGGQGALMLAARLRRLGLPTLIVEKNKALGDNWRKRYKTLVLHDFVWGNHFPYLPFPDDWPVFIPKDKIAGWFESYASIMELNVWLESTVAADSTVYDEDTGVWSITIRRADGSLRKLHPRHLVQATGHSGEPRIPHFEGTADFKGVLTHSSGHKGGDGWAGKKAVVIGSSNSGHDIAQEFFNAGADVTMVQRSSTLVISSDPGVGMMLKPAYYEGGPPTEEADLAFSSFPGKAALRYNKAVHALVNEADRELLAGLRKSGFRLDEENQGGLFVKYFSKGGGYYINVGCSDLIIEGKVKIKSGQEVERFESSGVKFKDGSILEADIVVLATGYTSMRETTRKIFGPTVADRTGPVWGLDDEGEIQGIWRKSGHPGFWYMGGNFLLARIYSHYLALQIKAIEVGLAPKV